MDLPSHGKDETPVEDVTLDMYVDAVIKEINKSTKQIVLIGHSAAGTIISSVAERVPERIRKLIYICAYAPKDGDALHIMRKRAKRQLVMPAILRADNGVTYSINKEKASSIFYHDCPDEAIQYALPRLSPQPTSPQETPVTLGSNYENLEKHYIICEDDHTIPPEEQEKMVADWPKNNVHRLNCGHSPFFSCPDTLARLLTEITENTP